MKYKYVKFSWGTARNNPEMILREYDRLISELDVKLEQFRKIKHTFKVYTNLSLFDYIKHKIPTHHNESFDIEFNFEEIEKIYKHALIDKSKEIEILRKQEDMKNEKMVFWNKYGI